MLMEQVEGDHVEAERLRVTCFCAAESHLGQVDDGGHTRPNDVV